MHRWTECGAILPFMKGIELSLSSLGDHKWIVGVVAICLCGSMVYFLVPGRRTAPSGRVPGVPPAGNATAELPPEVMSIPRLSEDEMKRLKAGEEVEIKTNGGVLKLNNPRPKPKEVQ